MMTFNTNWNYVKPMVFSVAFVMMVFFCWSRTIETKQVFGRQYALISNIRTYNLSSLVGNLAFFAMGIFFICLFPFFALSITFPNNFAFFTLLVSLVYIFELQSILPVFLLFPETYFTLIVKPVFPNAVLVKFRQWFDLFAMTTLFCYDLFRHLLLLVRSNCLEPVAAQTAVGLFYAMTNLYILQEEKTNKIVIKRK